MAKRRSGARESARAPITARKRPRNPDWLTLGLDSWALGMDAAAVIGLRLSKLGTGDAAAAIEAQRMISEKVEAAIGLQMLAWQGGLGESMQTAMAGSLKHYGPLVRANRRRLRSP